MGGGGMSEAAEAAEAPAGGGHSEVCEGDGAPLVSCGRWRRPREAEGFEEAVRGFRTARTCGFGGPFALCFLLQVSRRASSQTLGRDVEELPPAAGRGTPSPESASGWSLRFYESGANHPVSSPGLRPADRKEEVLSECQHHTG